MSDAGPKAWIDPRFLPLIRQHVAEYEARNPASAVGARDPLLDVAKGLRMAAALASQLRDRWPSNDESFSNGAWAALGQLESLLIEQSEVLELALRLTGRRA